MILLIFHLLNDKSFPARSNPNFRIKSHFNSFGSEWTKKFKPINLIKLIPNCTSYDEDKYTIKYMESKGRIIGDKYILILTNC